ncbi:MAG: hypothetical protein A2458_04065 [Candidatus Kerfeldbacteria bacterium RIFOXYC2_FULL_38_9]|uniref:DUF3048 domain-containing protein n=1 Tax=Candidatus Kerfeldbacteria bacterium RIFOXYB2_FULL_38_14 TaxID=1798547 RepID=A0A1G2BCJ7_9BACT|nr:MAG: hypothetical protein A2319_05680 [Candidatus Kerfeldbacteria bacterium RIFOXYB2_FULL_38_14]OGY89238.1 MAG: hypothetical protein A2458_04065 [Candidatus Kerfeldbacteria bacterium RIFOXYC2_FULL_38_9]
MSKKEQQHSTLDNFIKKIKKDPKKKVIYLGIIVALGIILVLIFFIFVLKGKNSSNEDSFLTDISTDLFGSAEEEEATIIPRRLDGVLAPKAEANIVPACVMIENAAFDGVRPQSGLSQAQLVYEVIVEGGITRFMAVFSNATQANAVIGPVRSARDTYLEFVSELQCAYAHAGGSYTAMVAIPEFGLRDIDGLRESQYFNRVAVKFSPHNLFSSTDDLFRAIVDHNWSKEEEPSYQSWEFADDFSSSAAPSINRIFIGFGGSYDVEYKYSVENNNYERYNGGVIQKDANNDQVLAPKNIIIEHVGDGIPLPEKGRINWIVTGEGEVEIYHSGQKFTGKWKKDDRLSRTQFFDEKGNKIPLERGTTWVEIVPPAIPVQAE